MYTLTTESSLDVAYWFIDRAEQDCLYLENEKLQYLLFFSQHKYAQKEKNKMLMPCVFVCDEHGFFEPTIKKVFAQGRPFMQTPKFNKDISFFLEGIWNEFSSLSILECKKIATNLPIYVEHYKKGQHTIVNFGAISKSEQITFKPNITPRGKILLSQNGPVVVSKWSPRKINM